MPFAQHCIGAIRADGSAISSKYLSFFSFGLTDLQLAFVVQIKILIFNSHQHQADTATIPVLRQCLRYAQFLEFIIFVSKNKKSMSVYLLMFHVKPFENNPDFTTLAGAYINCWIVSNTILEAEKIAATQISELLWEIINLEEGYEITEKYYIEDPKGLEVYNQVLIDKEVYTIHTYENDEE